MGNRSAAFPLNVWGGGEGGEHLLLDFAVKIAL